MKRILLGAASALAVTVGAAAPAQADYTLTILHFNDFHARFESINAFDSNCDAETEAAGECFGGIARLKTAIDMRRDALSDQNVVLLSAGDNFQGSLFYTQYKSELIAEFMNDLGVDAMVTGNHEFDDRPAELARMIDLADFPVIGGNFDVSNEPELAGKLPGVTILTVGGERIAVIGALTEDTPEISSPGDNITFYQAENYIGGAIPVLEEAGINKVIVLSHTGFNREQEIAAAVPGVDVIVGGHTNTLLSNTNEDAVGPYPFMVTGADGTEVPVVQAYAYGKYLGELTVTWDDAGNVISATGEPILLDASIEPDQSYLDRVAEAAGPLEELKAQVIGTATDAIVGDRSVCRAMECSMGNLVADALLDRTAGQGVQIAITNGGGLRASIDAGEITMGEVLTVLPFSNTLATFELTGADLLTSLENGVSQVEEGGGRFPQVAGLQFTFDISKPAGERISDVMVKEGEEWVPIDPEKTYAIVTNNFVRNGGDGYALFASNGMNAYDFGPPLEQVVADYVASLGGEYTPYTDGRITDATPAAPAEEPAAEEPAAEEPAAEAPAAEEPAAEAPAEGEAMPPADGGAMAPADGGAMAPADGGAMAPAAGQ